VARSSRLEPVAGTVPQLATVREMMEEEEHAG